MITGIFGDLGKGKTLTATKYAYLYHKAGYNIYSNYHLSFPHTLIDVEFLENIVKENTNFKGKNLFVLDELDMYVDSRMSISKRNRLILYFVKQLRKKNIKMIYATQMEHSVDKRLRGLTRTHILCDAKDYKIVTVNGETVEFKIIINHVFINRRKIATKQFVANKYYGLYNTREVITYTPTGAET